MVVSIKDQVNGFLVHCQFAPRQYFPARTQESHSRRKMKTSVAYLFAVLSFLGRSAAFQVAPTGLPNTGVRYRTILYSTTPEQTSEISNVEKFLQSKYPEFLALIGKNSQVMKTLRESNTEGYTLFAPNTEAFANLGDKKRAQLQDPRNLETAEKMGAYHVVASEPLTATRLFRENWTVPKQDGKPVLAIGGIKSLGGDVPVGRTKSGGLLGWGAKEDGGVTVGPDAKIVQSWNVGNCIVHEVDALVSPVILWRYCDQLRIPGF
jgi:uncharacterized surface protein with fasciclin (FAS1) repeats